MLAFLIAAAAAVWGSFGKIQDYVHKYAASNGGAAREYRYTMTWWKLDESGPSAGLPRNWFPPYGVLVAIGAGLLVFAGILALAAFAGRRSGLVTGARVSAAAGVGLMAGLAAIRLMDALQVLDQVNAEELQPGDSTEFEMGLGVYLPGGAVAMGLIGLGLMIPKGRAGRVEPDTPRMGIPMPYPQQQYQGYPQPPVSQPFPAQPTSQPFPAQQPTSQPFPVQQPTPQPFPAEPPTPQPTPAQPPTSQPFPVQQPTSGPIPQAQPPVSHPEQSTPPPDERK